MGLAQHAGEHLALLLVQVGLQVGGGRGGFACVRSRIVNSGVIEAALPVTISRRQGAFKIDGSKLVDGSITIQDMAPNSVDGSKILDGSIGNADHADGVLTGSKLASGTVTGTQIASATIAGANLQAATITSDKLAAGMRKTRIPP